jgi:general L-amino acid transport system permease protein
MAAPEQTTTAAAQPSMGPPDHRLTPAVWIRQNLFPNWWNGLLTLIIGPFLALGLFGIARFLFVTGRWDIIEVNLTNLMIGTYPRGELHRLWIAIAILSAVVGLGIGITSSVARAAALSSDTDLSSPWHDKLRRAGPPLTLLVVLMVFVRTATPLLLLFGVLLLAVLAFRLGRWLPPRSRGLVNLAVIVGVVASQLAISGLDGVPRTAWGGLLLTGYFTLGALVLAFPIGVAVALGRRSSLPVVRGTCMVFIEFFRGVPLIVLLFAGWLVLGFFLPPQFPTPNIVTRALVIFVIFTAAYVAEIIRGGLQGIPRGQWEAAQALGLSPWKQTRLIVLPQAIRSVIPALVGQAISLFKDTTLVIGIGLLDLLGVAQNITQQEQFRGQGYIAESLVFISLIYWVGSYWMSRESQRLEAKLGVGVR